MVNRRLAELASGSADAPNVGIPQAPKVERLQTLLLSVFPEPVESGWIESVLAKDAGFSGATVCQFIRERFSR
jgi:hypothetical protein